MFNQNMTIFVKADRFFYDELKDNIMHFYEGSILGENHRWLFVEVKKEDNGPCYCQFVTSNTNSFMILLTRDSETFDAVIEDGFQKMALIQIHDLDEIPKCDLSDIQWMATLSPEEYSAV